MELIKYKNNFFYYFRIIVTSWYFVGNFTYYNRSTVNKTMKGNSSGFIYLSIVSAYKLIDSIHKLMVGKREQIIKFKSLCRLAGSQYFFLPWLADGVVLVEGSIAGRVVEVSYGWQAWRHAGQSGGGLSIVVTVCDPPVTIAPAIGSNSKA